MADKVLVAVSRIKYGGEVANPGDLLKPSKLTKEQIKRLYDIGSIRIQDAVAVKTEPSGPEDIENIANKSQETEKPKEPAKTASQAESVSATPTKAASPAPPPIKPEVSDAKSTDK